MITVIVSHLWKKIDKLSLRQLSDLDYSLQICCTHLSLFKVKDTNTINSSPKWPGYLSLWWRGGGGVRGSGEGEREKDELFRYQAIHAETHSKAHWGVKNSFSSILTSFSAYDGTRPSNLPSVRAIIILEVFKPAFWICSFAWKWRIIIQFTI